MAGLAGRRQYADDDVGLGQHLVQRRQLIHLIEAGALIATVADAEHPHAEVLGGVSYVLAYAAGAQDQHGASLEPLIGMALPQSLLLLFAVERQLA